MKNLRLVLLNFAVVVLALPGMAQADDPGYALRFDGVSDFVRLAPTASVLAPGWQSTKTVSVWVRPTGVATCTGADPAACDAIFGDRPRTWGISRGSLGGLDRIWVWNYDGTFDRIGIEYTPGEWAQIALVHGGGSLKAYKNGVLVGTVTTGATQLAGAPVLQFGGIINNASRNWTFEGEIDELRLWNLAQTEAEIVADVNRTLTGAETGLAAYYRMSNGFGTTVTDDSGHSWTGTLHDGVGDVPANGPITWVVSGALGSTGTINNPPVADAQSVLTTEDTAVGITLTGSDANGDPLTFRVVTQPGHGSLTGAAPALTYAPAANYAGLDSFTFVVNDGLVDSAARTVSLTITAVNDPPVPGDDETATDIDTAKVVGVLSNDTDAEGETLTIVSVGAAANGSVVNNGSDITYTPNSGFSGTDTFSYTVSDPHGEIASADVTVAVFEGANSGFALRFDGLSDFATLGQTSQMLAPGWQSTKTVELWVRPLGVPYCNVPTPASCDAIFGDRPRWWGISRGVVGGLDRIAVWNWDGGLNVVYIDYTPDEWIHIAMVHTGGTLSAYKNGVLVGSVPSAATMQPNQVGANPVLQFGGIINNSSRNWTHKGDIDEVRIWNSARTAAQIAQNMNRSLSGMEFDLAAYYRMTDGAGASVTDDSGHGWTGTLHDGGIGVAADGPIQWVVP
jgi:hypothetical protein